MATWLLIDDDPDIYDTMLAVFGLWDVEAIGFLDGDHMIDWLNDVDAGHYKETLAELPVLALSDIRLPGKASGVDIGARIRKSPVLGNIALVLMTAYHLSPQEEKQVMTASGADKILYKPLPKLQELRGVLEAIIKKKQDDS